MSSRPWRFAGTRPDRYEADYAASEPLSEVGQSQAALEHAEQSLEIYQHLAAKRPEKFDYLVINTACSMQLGV